MAGAAFGAAGQRCMALSTAVWVGEAKEWIPELVERARALKVNAGMNTKLLNAENVMNPSMWVLKGTGRPLVYQGVLI